MDTIDEQYYVLYMYVSLVVYCIHVFFFKGQCVYYICKLVLLLTLKIITLIYLFQISLPESNLPPTYEEDEDPYPVEEEDDDGEGMAKLADFLQHLGLEKYYDNFEASNIDFNQLLQMSTEDMKKIVE